MKRNSCNSLAIAFLLCIGIFFCACYSGEKHDPEKREKFQVTHPKLLDTVYTNEYVAEIQSVQNVEIRSRVKGFIEKIHVDEGQPVRAGQVLFTLSNREFKEDLYQANAELKSAMADLKAMDVEMKSTQELADENIVSKSELEKAQAKKEAIEAKIDVAKSAISVANLNLSFTQVKAPFDGIINRIPNKMGSLVEDGTLLTSISDNKEVFAYFNVSEKDYLDYITSKQDTNSKEVSLILSNGSLYNQKGIIQTTESEINKETGNIAFRAKFANPEQILKHGNSGKILVKKELKNVLLIPQKSTFEIQEDVYVYVVGNDSTVQMRKIVPSVRLTNAYVISSGLTIQDKVIYEGIQQVKEGDKIIPELISFDKKTTNNP